MTIDPRDWVDAPFGAFGHAVRLSIDPLWHVATDCPAVAEELLSTPEFWERGREDFDEFDRPQIDDLVAFRCSRWNGEIAEKILRSHFGASPFVRTYLRIRHIDTPGGQP